MPHKPGVRTSLGGRRPRKNIARRASMKRTRKVTPLAKSVPQVKRTTTGTQLRFNGPGGGMNKPIVNKVQTNIHRNRYKGRVFPGIGEFRLIGNGQYKWAGQGNPPMAWIDCEEDNGMGWSSDCEGSTYDNPGSSGWSDESGEYPGMSGGGTGTVFHCPECGGKATVHPTY